MFLVGSEQAKSRCCFEVRNLFTERRLGYVQSDRGPTEVQIFNQGNDCTSDIARNGECARSRKSPLSLHIRHLLPRFVVCPELLRQRL